MRDMWYQLSNIRCLHLSIEFFSHLSPKYSFFTRLLLVLPRPKVGESCGYPLWSMSSSIHADPVVIFVVSHLRFNKYVCACVCLCVCLCLCLCLCLCMSVWLCVILCVWVNICVSVGVFVFVLVNVSVICVWVYVSVCACVRLSVYFCVLVFLWLPISLCNLCVVALQTHLCGHSTSTKLFLGRSKVDRPT